METHMLSRTRTLNLMAAAVIAITADAYARFYAGALTPPAPDAATQAVSAVTTPPPTPPGNLPNFASIVAESAPAVVNISVSGMTKAGLPRSQSLDPSDPPFAEFFRRFQQQIPQTPSRGLGSGFILRADGLVITNAHVVDGASEVIVKLTDKREFRAKILGIDKPTDLALLKIEAHDLPVVRVGSPSQTNVGDWVLAIGSSFGFENSVTAGIISAKGRALPEEAYVPFIQTDVAVNPGNSGGPLLNLRGEVIGINSQIYSHSGGYQGISFAIPIDVALKIEQQLVRYGKVSRGRLGISVQSVDPALADSFGLEKATGALIDDVQHDGPGAQAGLKPGDIILQVDGRAIDEFTDLSPIVANLKPGSKVGVRIWRDQRPREFTVQASQLEDPSEEDKATPELGHNALGLAVRPLSPNESRQLDATGGLLVQQSIGRAEQAGIQPGDIVLALNGQPLTEARQLRDLTPRSTQHVALLIQRGTTRLFVPLDLS